MPTVEWSAVSLTPYIPAIPVSKPSNLLKIPDKHHKIPIVNPIALAKSLTGHSKLKVNRFSPQVGRFAALVGENTSTLKRVKVRMKGSSHTYEIKSAKNQTRKSHRKKLAHLYPRLAFSNFNSNSKLISLTTANTHIYAKQNAFLA